MSRIDAKSKQTILGVIAPDGARTWFFKLKGDTELAAREAPRFKAFVQSVKFNQAVGANDGK